MFIAPVTTGDGVNTPPVTPYQGLDHFGLTVKDIDAVAAEIKAKGVEFTKERTTIRPGVRICFIRGPQGISIELLERDKNTRDSSSRHGRSVRVSARVRHAARHEATDGQSAISAYRPHDGSADAIRFGDHGVVGYVKPIAVDANAVVPAFRFPIHVADGAAVRVGTARSLPAPQTVNTASALS